MRYYSTQRPVTPGSFPKPAGNKVVEIHNYDSKTYCEELGREVWGYIVYEDEGGKLWKYTEPGGMPRERHDRLYRSTNNALDGEPCWPMLPDIDYRIEGDRP